MKRKILLVAITLLATLSLIVLLPRHKRPTLTKAEIAATLKRTENQLYRQEILCLYHPPDEVFTANGLEVFRTIQREYSSLFLPYLLIGATPVQPDVFYNPFFDLYVLVKDSEGLIDSIIVISSITPDQVPQMQIKENFWQEMLKRFQIAEMNTFSDPKLLKDLSLPIVELRNLTNDYGWPAQIELTDAKAKFNLYIQRPNQGIYCSTLEPGAFFIMNVVSNQLKTNILYLPPYTVRAMEKTFNNAKNKDASE